MLEVSNNLPQNRNWTMTLMCTSLTLLAIRSGQRSKEKYHWPGTYFTLKNALNEKWLKSEDKWVEKYWLSVSVKAFNPLQTKRRPFYLKPQSVPRCKQFSSRLYKPISLCCKWHKSLFFSDKYKTYKYSVGRAYICWMLNWWCITWPVGFKILNKSVLLISHIFIICIY